MKIRLEKRGGGAKRLEQCASATENKAHGPRLLITKSSSKLAVQCVTAKHFAIDVHASRRAKHAVEY